MSTLDLVLMAFRNLIKRKLRTCLTVLGVIIGTMAIVVMISVGLGMNKSFEEMLQEMGNITVITVYGDSDRMVYISDGSQSGAQQQASLDDKALNEFSKLNGVEAVTPVVYSYFTLYSGKYSTWFDVQGIDMSILEKLGYRIGEGRNVDENDSFGAVVGTYYGENFRDMSKRNPYSQPPVEVDLLEDSFKVNVLNATDGKGKPIGKTVDIEITGILESGGSNDYYAFMSLEDVNKLNEEKEKEEKKQGWNTGGGSNSNRKSTNYEQALVKCTNIKMVTDVQETIRDMGFQAYSNGEWLSSMQSTSEGLQKFLGIIGAVALFVAAIGIANTMLMSIYERTREIGVMKVIGASLNDIKRLFLVEAAVIGFMGGLVGVGLSYGVSQLMNLGEGFDFLSAYTYSEMSTVSIIPLWLAALGLVFSTAIGVLSGYFPARRAMKLSALAAIKTE